MRRERDSWTLPFFDIIVVTLKGMLMLFGSFGIVVLEVERKSTRKDVELKTYRRYHGEYISMD